MTTNASGIKAVLFDYGGVIMRTVDPRPRRELERMFGLELFGADRLVFGHPLWDEAQLGRISSDDVWADLGRQLELDSDGLAEFRERFWDGDRLDAELVALIRELREACYRIGLLSNNPASLRQRVDQLLPGIFHVSVISGIDGIMKPSRGFFELALVRLGVKASEAVFVDDFEVNVVGAREAGLHGLHFRGLPALRRDLRALGVTVLDPAVAALPGIRTVIFDWGGVMEQLPDGAHFAQWEQKMQLEPGTLRDVLWGEEYRRLEAGQISEYAFVESVADRLGFETAEVAADFVREFYTHDWLYEETLAAVRALRGRYAVGLLSNAFPGQEEWIQEQYGIDVHAEFDVYVNSAYVGLRKPDPPIYELVLERLGAEPEQAVFLDDGLRNVDAARAIGMNSIQFLDQETSLGELEALLGHSW